jgi:stage V sporulation protein G
MSGLGREAQSEMATNDIPKSKALNITKVQLTKLENSKTLALSSITIDKCLVITGLRVLKGKNGMWVAMPSRKVNDEYNDVVFPVTREAYEQIQETVLAKFTEVNDAQLKPRKQEYKAPVEDYSQAGQQHQQAKDNVTEDDLPF